MGIKQTIPNSTNNTKSITFQKLRGVDYSSSPFEISGTRSADMKNIINEDGVNHKRKGWTSNVKINKNFTERKIYEICEFAGRYLVVASHHDSPNVINLYDWNGVSNLEDAKFVVMITDTNYYDVPEKSLAVINNDQVYVTRTSNNPVIVVYNKETDTLEVNNDYFYVPTTSISINDADEESGSAAYEEPNMLTTRRKNKLTGKQIETVKVTFVSETYDISNITILNGPSSSPLEVGGIITYDGDNSSTREVSFRLKPSEYSPYVMYASLSGSSSPDNLYDENYNLIGEAGNMGANSRSIIITEDLTIKIAR